MEPREPSPQQTPEQFKSHFNDIKTFGDPESRISESPGRAAFDLADKASRELTFDKNTNDKKLSILDDPYRDRVSYGTDVTLGSIEYRHYYGFDRPDRFSIFISARELTVRLGGAARKVMVAYEVDTEGQQELRVFDAEAGAGLQPIDLEGAPKDEVDKITEHFFIRMNEAVDTEVQKTLN